MAQAQAEIRRAAAVALEQEMKARVQEMQAKVVESQAQVPARHGRGLPQRPAGRHGLLPDGKHPVRHRDADKHLAARGEEVTRSRTR